MRADPPRPSSRHVRAVHFDFSVQEVISRNKASLVPYSSSVFRMPMSMSRLQLAAISPRAPLRNRRKAMAESSICRPVFIVHSLGGDDEGQRREMTLHPFNGVCDE